MFVMSLLFNDGSAVSVSRAGLVGGSMHTHSLRLRPRLIVETSGPDRPSSLSWAELQDGIEEDRDRRFRDR